MYFGKDNMNILILNPPYKEKMVKEGRCQQKSDLLQTIYPPLESAYLAAILRKKAKVTVLDCIAGDCNKKELINFYLTEKPKKVFVNTATQTINNDLGIIKELNTLYPSEFILFGVYAQYFRKKISKIKNIIVPESIEEYAYGLIGEKFNPKNLDILPFPAWDLINLKNYRLPITADKFVLIQTATGCPYECIFCTVPFYHGKKVVKRSIDSVIREIEYIKTLGVKNVIFFADNFTSDKEWVKRLCNEIIKRKIKIKFLCNSRVDSIDQETVDLMKKAGCWLISFGIESGNQKLLDSAKKGIKIEDTKKAISASNKAGILTLGNFVLGLPGENKYTIQRTIQFANTLKLDFAAFNIATPFPGSALYEKYKNKKIDWEKLQYSSQMVCPELDLEYWQKKAYRSFYSKRPVERLVRIIKIVGITNPLRILKSAFNLFFRILI